MNRKISLVALGLAVGLSGCASLQQSTGMDSKTAGAVGGGVIGCVGGAVLSKVLGGNPLAGCAAGAVAGGLLGFEKARQDEIAAAQQTRNELAASLASAPASRAQVGEVKTVEVTAVDKRTRETRKYQAFDSVSVDLPISTKGTPEHDAAMAKLKTLAQRVASERGSAEIVVALAPGDARSRKVSASSDSVPGDNGGVITVTKAVDAAVPRGVERITVKAGRLQTEV